MSTVSDVTPPGGTLICNWISGYTYIFVPPMKVNSTVPGYHVADPVFSTCHPTVNRSPGLTWLPFAMDCISRLQSSGPTGVLEAVGLKNSTMGVNVSGSGVTVAVAVGESVASAVAVCVIVASGLVDVITVGVLVGAGVAVG